MGFPPTPEEIIGLVFILAFFVIDFILGIVTGQQWVWITSALGIAATCVYYIARRKAGESVVPIVH